MTANPRYQLVNDRFRERFESLPDKLRAHIFRVRDVGLDLASRHGVDEERAEQAILGHDVARASKKEEILRLADRFGMPTLDIERRAPVTLHGPVGAELLRHEDGLDDEEILAAVRWHTTGHPSLTPLGLLVFIADKLEPRKNKVLPLPAGVAAHRQREPEPGSARIPVPGVGPATAESPASPSRQCRNCQRLVDCE